MSQDSREAARVRWAQLRFSIIGTLMTSPPKLGELKALLRELAKKPYTHPTRDDVVYFAAATIESWYYRARETDKPIVAHLPRHATLPYAGTAGRGISGPGNDAGSDWFSGRRQYITAP